MIQQVNQFTHRLLRPVARGPIERQGVEFGLIEQAIRSIGVDPHVEREINLLDRFCSEHGGLHDVAVPALQSDRRGRSESQRCCTSDRRRNIQ